MQALSAVLLLGLLGHTLGQSLSSLPLNTISVPAGFSIALYSQSPVNKARQMALSGNDSRIVYVGSTADTVTWQHLAVILGGQTFGPFTEEYARLLIQVWLKDRAVLFYAGEQAGLRASAAY